MTVEAEKAGRTRSRQEARRDRLCRAVLIVAAVATIGLILFSLHEARYYGFSSQRWIEERGDPFGFDRQLMVRGLLRRRLLDGESKTAVRELLGEPDWEEDASWSYYMGFDPRHAEYGSGPEMRLVVEFRDGCVSRAYVPP